MEQVRVRALPASTDAPSQLVELREAEQVGPVDHERVHGGHVEPALDDRRAHEHVVLVLPEVLHDPLEPRLVHLPVRDRDPRFGHQRAHVLGDELDVAHAVVHVEHLTLAQQLAPDRFRGGVVVVLAHVGEDRLAVFGRRVHEREVADAGERQLQRARDRRGGEREHVDVGAHVLDALLVLHAEALLLVDDEQAELRHLHVVGEQPVGADHHVDRAGFEVAGDRRLLLRRQEAREHLHPHRVVGEPLAEGLAVLAREQRGRERAPSPACRPAPP